MIIRNNLSRFTALALSVFASAAFALPEDRDQPIYVTADTATINDNTGITTYKGNAIIKQGTLLIEAAHVDIYRSDGELDKLIAKGKLAHFRQQPKIDQPYSDAWGLHMVYNVDDQMLTITGDAKVIQNKDTFTGKKVIYDIDRSIVNAFGRDNGENGDGRVNMVIQPKEKKADK
jgi:lipopolysaccharide export system protein LptA